MSHLPDGADLVAWVENGPAGSTWGPRRGLNRVAPGIERTLLIEAVRSAMADPTGHVVTIEERSGLRGLTTLLPKPIESQQLAVSTGAVGTCLTDSAGNRRHDTACLLRQVDREALERGIELLILRIDSDDAGALAAAQDCGYRVAEATVAWLAERQTTTPASLAGRLEVETFKGAAIRDALTSSEVAELAERTSNWRDNHFRADPRLTSEQVDRFYEVWVHNIASARWCDALHVARTDGRMVGLLSEVIDDAVLSCGGPTVRAGEWMVSLEPGLAAGATLLHTAARRAAEGQFLWWETQLRNLSTIRSIELTRSARPIRTSYTLHGWPEP